MGFCTRPGWQAHFLSWKHFKKISDFCSFLHSCFLESLHDCLAFVKGRCWRNFFSILRTSVKFCKRDAFHWSQQHPPPNSVLNVSLVLHLSKGSKNQCSEVSSPLSLRKVLSWLVRWHGNADGLFWRQLKNPHTLNESPDGNLFKPARLYSTLMCTSPVEIWAQSWREVIPQKKMEFVALLCGNHKTLRCFWRRTCCCDCKKSNLWKIIDFSKENKQNANTRVKRKSLTRNTISLWQEMLADWITPVGYLCRVCKKWVSLCSNHRSLLWCGLLVCETGCSFGWGCEVFCNWTQKLNNALQSVFPTKRNHTEMLMLKSVGYIVTQIYEVMEKMLRLGQLVFYLLSFVTSEDLEAQISEWDTSRGPKWLHLRGV